MKDPPTARAGVNDPPTTGKDETAMEVVPSTSADDNDLTAEEKEQRDEILAAIQNDPEAVRDEQVNEYLNEPVMIREATSTSLPQVNFIILV